MSNQEIAVSNKSKSNNTSTPKTDNNNNNNNNNSNTAINLSTPSRKVGDNSSVNSCLSGPNNPKTLRRTKEGKIQVVHFDERVVVHTVPHWDPSRTQSFSDVSNPANETTYVTHIVIITQNVQQQQQQQQQRYANSTTNVSHSTEKTQESQNHNNNNSNNSKDCSILVSPNNPATLRRLSQTDDSNKEVSWHKRVVVHRVPRSDASRSMFHPTKDNKLQNTNKCCIGCIVL